MFSGRKGKDRKREACKELNNITTLPTIQGIQLIIIKMVYRLQVFYTSV